MRQSDEVEAAHIVLPEKRGDNLHPSVEAPIIRATTVNEELMVIGHLDKDGIAGTYVQKGDAQLRCACRQVLPGTYSASQINTLH